MITLKSECPVNVEVYKREKARTDISWFGQQVDDGQQAGMGQALGATFLPTIVRKLHNGNWNWR